MATSTEELDKLADQTANVDISKDSTTETPDSASKTPTENGANATDATKPGVKSLSKAFRDNFKLFSKFGDTKSDGKSLTLSQSDKWMKQAKVIDGKKITTTDTGIYFKKFKWVCRVEVWNVITLSKIIIWI